MPKNPVARSPLLRKGGVHTRSRSGERAAARERLNEALAEWQAEPCEKTKLQLDETSRPDYKEMNHAGHSN